MHQLHGTCELFFVSVMRQCYDAGGILLFSYACMSTCKLHSTCYLTSHLVLGAEQVTTAATGGKDRRTNEVVYTKCCGDDNAFISPPHHAIAATAIVASCTACRLSERTPWNGRVDTVIDKPIRLYSQLHSSSIRPRRCNAPTLCARVR